jgi:hypothetical protein
MRIQAVLTPTESKKLLTKAVLARDEVKHALSKDIVVVHPSSSLVFFFEELGIPRPPGIWICGLVQPRGLCINGQIIMESIKDPEQGNAGPGPNYAHDWVLDKGKLIPGITLAEILERMGPGSVYLKGANAIDPDFNAGVLFMGPGGGTIARVMKAQREKGFHLLVPTGLEKFIPTRIPDCSKAAAKADISHCHGIPCGIIPIKGTLITEIEAFKLTCGVEAVPVAAGGVAGAEGGMVFILTGTSEALGKAEDLLSQIKGARLPNLYLLDCEVCPRVACHNSYAFKEKNKNRSGGLS